MKRVRNWYEMVEDSSWLFAAIVVCVIFLVGLLASFLFPSAQRACLNSTCAPGHTPTYTAHRTPECLCEPGHRPLEEPINP